VAQPLVRLAKRVNGSGRGENRLPAADAQFAAKVSVGKSGATIRAASDRIDSPGA